MLRNAGIYPSHCAYEDRQEHVLRPTPCPWWWPRHQVLTTFGQSPHLPEVNTREWALHITRDVQATISVTRFLISGSQEFCLLGNDESQPTFRRNISPPSSGSKDNPDKRPAAGFLAWFILRPWRWGRHVPPKRMLTYIAEDKPLYNCCQNLRSYNFLFHPLVYDHPDGGGGCKPHNLPPCQELIRKTQIVKKKT
jgi:hypothetical protein